MSSPLYPLIQPLPQRQHFLQFWGLFQESWCVNSPFLFSGKVVTPPHSPEPSFLPKGHSRLSPLQTWILKENMWISHQEGVPTPLVAKK